MEAKNKNRWMGFALIAMTFLFFLFFFTKLYPIVISNVDDYYCFANHRQIFPIWHGSEPIRVFPEVFMALSAQGMSVFYRIFGGNIFDYLTFGWAACVAAAMAGLVGILYRLLRKSGASALLTCAGLIVFLLMHFWIFKQKQQDGNIYMLHTVYACTYFYYVIPNLMNAILVLWIHTDPDLYELFRPGKYLKKGFFVLFAYLCIFSNLWAGAILAAYLGVRLVTDGISAIRNKREFRRWFADNYLILLLTVVWLISQVFEINGTRAAGIGLNLADQIGAIWQSAIGMFREVNTRYLLFCGLVVAGGLISFIIRKDGKILAFIGKFAVALVLFLAYYLLSCAKVGTYYVNRPDVFYGAFFFGAVIVLTCLFELLRRFPVGKLILPLLLIAILIDCNSMGKTYQDSIVCYRGETVELHRKINQDILNQLQEAEAAGLKETKIYVPDYGNVDNWPYADYMGEQAAKSFYKFGALKEEITITEVVPSQEKKRELGVGDP